jgi:hypothetical protein
VGGELTLDADLMIDVRGIMSLTGSGLLLVMGTSSYRID